MEKIMDLFKKVDNSLLTVIKNYLKDAYENERLASNIKFVIPPFQTGCDYSTNVAMIFSKALQKKPNDIATELCEKIMELDFVKSATPVNGYVNIKFKDAIWEEFLASIISEGEHFGDGDKSDPEKQGKVNLEFISANPTGPLHIGHCRGAILGLAIAKVMQKAGYDVTKEYYVNDYGGQIIILVNSVKFRYEQQFGLHQGENMPEGYYPSDYLVDYAKTFAQKYGDKYVGISEKEFYNNFKKEIVDAMMAIIKSDIKLLNLEMDVFTSETDIVEAGKIDKALDFLASKELHTTDENCNDIIVPYVYKGVVDAPVGKSANEEEQEESKYSGKEQTLFRSTLFGDDKDRVIKRPDGTTTYFASDIGYHKDKIDRGYTNLINIFGADHGGYVKRLTSVVDALSDKKATLKIMLCQMVSLEKNGEPFKMSKRKGTFVLLSDVAKSINVDELKLFMLSKSPDTQMTFDFVKIKEKSKDNLVYYIQYAYARTNSVLNNFENKFDYKYNFDPKDLDGLMENPNKLIKELTVFMAKYPQLIQISAKKHAPHMIVDYLKEFASLFHSIWSADIKLVDENNEKQTKSMMAFVTCVQIVIKNALQTLSIKAPEKM